MFTINVALLYHTPSETVILYVKHPLIKVYASDFTKGLNILKRHFIMLMAVVYILLNVFYSAFQTESTIHDTIVKSDRSTVTHLTLHQNLV